MAQDEHRALWPGVEIPISKVKFQRAATFGTGDDDADGETNTAWANATTQPTSMCMADLSWGMSHTKRMHEDKLFALESFRQLRVKLLVGTGGLFLSPWARGGPGQLAWIWRAQSATAICLQNACWRGSLQYGTSAGSLPSFLI